MIEHTVIEGRKATVAYLHSDWTLATPDDADLAKVVFEDGGVFFLKPTGKVVKDYNPDPKWTKDPETGEFTGSEPGQGGGGEGELEPPVSQPLMAEQHAQTTAKMAKAAQAKVKFDKSKNPKFFYVYVEGKLKGTGVWGGGKVTYITSGGFGEPAEEQVFESESALAAFLGAKPGEVATSNISFTPAPTGPGLWEVHAGGMLIGHATGGTVPDEPILYQPKGDLEFIGTQYKSWKALKEALQEHGPAGGPSTIAEVKYVGNKVGGWDVFVHNEKVGVVEQGNISGVVTYVPLASMKTGGYPEYHYKSFSELTQQLQSTAGPPPPHKPHETLAPAAKIPVASLPEPLVRVGGSEWNQDTAIRLGKEHAYVRPALQETVERVIGTTVTTKLGSWGQLSSDVQQLVETDWKQNTLSNEHNHLVESWLASDAGGEAMVKLATEFSEGSGDTDWAHDAIEEQEGERDSPYPFTIEQIMDAVDISIEGAMDYPQVEFHWDNDALDSPIGFDPEQQWLPGMQGPPPHERLGPDMRKGIEAALEAAIRARAEEIAPELPTPDYLEQQAQENADEIWQELSDEEKFQFSFIHGYHSKGEEAEGEVVEVAKPDPLNDRMDDNYRATQKLAKAMSIDRSYEVMKQRGITTRESDPERLQEDIRIADDKLWQGWVDSSTSSDGLILQMVAADELGGRLNEERLKPYGGSLGVRNMADREYAHIGGYEGLKAYIRGKWEVTQELLDRAGVQEVEVYRAIHPTALEMGEPVAEGSHRRLPNATFKRNGLASFSMDPNVTNKWGGSGTRAVIRARIPRTAVISFPAYGKNVQREREVIVAGTGWAGWDAWAGAAPEFERMPLQIQRGSAEEQSAWQERQQREREREQQAAAA